MPVLTNGVDSIPKSSASRIPDIYDGQLPLLAGFRPVAIAQDNDGQISLKRLAEDDIDVEYRIYRVANHIPAIGFNRLNRSDVWRVTTLDHGTQTMSARVDPGGSAALASTMSAPSGRVAVFVRAFVEDGARASGRILIKRNDETLLSTSIDMAPSEEQDLGWHWINVGAFDSQGGEVDVKITATNELDDHRRYIDLERVALVRTEDVDSMTAPETGKVTLIDDEWKAIDLEAYANGEAIMMFEALDSFGNRYLLYHP